MKAITGEHKSESTLVGSFASDALRFQPDFIKRNYVSFWRKWKKKTNPQPLSLEYGKTFRLHLACKWSVLIILAILWRLELFCKVYTLRLIFCITVWKQMLKKWELQYRSPLHFYLHMCVHIYIYTCIILREAVCNENEYCSPSTVKLSLHSSNPFWIRIIFLSMSLQLQCDTAFIMTGDRRATLA